MKLTTLILLSLFVSTNSLAHNGKTKKNNTISSANAQYIKQTEDLNAPLVSFDTLEMFKKLKGVGFNDKQAEMIVQIQKITVKETLEQAKKQYHLDDVATRRDLQESLTKAELALDSTRWNIGIGILLIAIVLVFFRYKVQKI